MASLEQPLSDASNIADNNVVNDSSEQESVKESSQNMADTVETKEEPSLQKKAKVWLEEETRLMIHLYISSVLNNPGYSRKTIWLEVSKGLRSQGYVKSPDRIGMRMKTLRSSYRKIVEYNKRHVHKKEFPYMSEIAELYALTSNVNTEHNTQAINPGVYRMSSSRIAAKKIKIVRSPSQRQPQKLASARIALKKATQNGISPMFQCGLCLGKFHTSNEMHAHECTAKKRVTNNSTKRKSNVPTSKIPFQWSGMSTLHFLEILREYKLNGTNLKQGKLLDYLSSMMKKKGITVTAVDIEKKWIQLASNYEKTVSFNQRNQETKRCAFFNRLTELYNHGATMDMMKNDEPVKMTVEVSPFIFSKNNHHTNQDTKAPNFGTAPNQNSELVQWLDSFWKEWKQIHAIHEQSQAQRHLELMEILSFLAENAGNK